jgi:hypothetical protein
MVLALVPAIVALVAATVPVYAAGGTNVLANGDFEANGGSLTGWTKIASNLALAADGDGGGSAALVSFKGTAKYGLTTSPNPVTGAPAGATYAATGRVRSASPGKNVCLIIQEWSPGGGSLVQSSQQCAAATGAWASLPTVGLTVRSDGDELAVRVHQQNGVTGDSFEADTLTLLDTDTTVPADGPPSVPAGVAAAARSATAVDVSWTASTDTDGTGVAGYTITRNGSPFATVNAPATTFTDASASPSTTYQYAVAAFDTAQKSSAPSLPATVTTPPAATAGGADDVWHLDETSGTAMTDSGQTPHPGTLHNIALGQEGDPSFPGTSYGFNGASSFVSIPDAPDLNAEGKDVRIAFSLKTTTVPAQPDYDLFRKGQYPGTEYKLELQPNGQLSCEFRTLQADGTIRGYTIQPAVALQDGHWHRLTCAKVGGKMTVTIDGTAFTKNITGSISNSYNMIIGSYSAKGGGDYYQGLLDEISFRTG